MLTLVRFLHRVKRCMSRWSHAPCVGIASGANVCQETAKIRGVEKSPITMLRFLMAGLAAPRSAASFVAVMDGDDFRMGVAATSTFTEEADR
jgi:hypothetical protein